MLKIKTVVFILVALAVVHQAISAENSVTTPKEFLGSNIGDDCFLANYTQLTGYWKKLEQESDRIKLVGFGTSAEGRTTLMAVITSPENHKKLDRYREISRRLVLTQLTVVT